MLGNISSITGGVVYQAQKVVTATLASTGTVIKQITISLSGVISALVGVLSPVKVTPPATITITAVSVTTLTMTAGSATNLTISHISAG
jgi:hypothetical protein